MWFLGVNLGDGGEQNKRQNNERKANNDINRHNRGTPKSVIKKTHLFNSRALFSNPKRQINRNKKGNHAPRNKAN